MSGICPPVPILPKRIGLIDHLNSTQLHCIMFVLNCRHCTLHSDQLSWQHAPIDFHGCPPLMRLFGGASTCPSIRHNLVSFRVNLTSPVCVFVTPLRSTGSCRLICSRGTPNTQAFMALRWGGGVRPPERRSIVQASRQSGAAATSKHVLVTISI